MAASSVWGTCVCLLEEQQHNTYHTVGRLIGLPACLHRCGQRSGQGEGEPKAHGRGGIQHRRGIGKHDGGRDRAGMVAEEGLGRRARLAVRRRVVRARRGGLPPEEQPVSLPICASLL